MSETHEVTPTEARRLLQQADQLSRSAHEAVRWPYITFILALGMATSFGTFAMGLTTGNAFGLAYFGTLAAGFALIMFFCISIQGRSAFAWSRRWMLYMAGWTVTYLAAIAVVVWVHDSVLWSGITSGLVLAVTLTSAAVEARR